MKLESLTLEKFKENSLKKEQMFLLGARNTVTEGGSRLGEHSNLGVVHYNYGHDVIRANGVTYHNRIVVHRDSSECQYL